MTPARPFTPESLAERWDCSAEKVRRMYHDGQIVGFRLGKLIRIPAAEVERIECQNQNTQSESTEESPSCDTRTQTRGGFESRLARQTGASLKPAPLKSGQHETRRSARG